MLLRPIVCLFALSLPLSAALALSPELKPAEGAPAAEPAVPPLGSPAPGAGEAPVVEAGALSPLRRSRTCRAAG